MKGHKPSTALERFKRNVDAEEYQKIRDTWERHVDLEAGGYFEQAVQETMVEDCVYELAETGQSWQGHEGAMAFYDIFRKAFPDPEWELLDIAVGPQGVLGIANMTAKQEGPFHNFDKIGHTVHGRIINMFTWNPKAQMFAGERVHYLGPWPPGSKP